MVAAVAELMRLEGKGLMESYDGIEEKWIDEERFLELIIVDGCFFLDLLIWNTVDFYKPYMNVTLWMDRSRLENQLPLAALAILIDVGGNKQSKDKSRSLRQQQGILESFTDIDAIIGQAEEAG